ncbi:hypothetical protein CsSME_00034574 [Camellia sinensis var. sinensis]
MAENHRTAESEKLLLTQHAEKHFTAGEIVRDIIIGISDGLTVPFALTAGLSSANASSSIILTADIAEVVADAISMGFGEHHISDIRSDLREEHHYVDDVLLLFCFEGLECPHIDHQWQPIILQKWLFV